MNRKLVMLGLCVLQCNVFASTKFLENGVSFTRQVVEEHPLLCGALAATGIMGTAWLLWPSQTSSKVSPDTHKKTVVTFKEGSDGDGIHEARRKRLDSQEEGAGQEESPVRSDDGKEQEDENSILSEATRVMAETSNADEGKLLERLVVTYYALNKKEAHSYVQVIAPLYEQSTHAHRNGALYFADQHSGKGELMHSFVRLTSSEAQAFLRILATTIFDGALQGVRIKPLVDTLQITLSRGASLTSAGVCGKIKEVMANRLKYA